MASKESQSLRPPTPLAVRFVRIVGGFGIAVGIGLGPFLGKIPGIGALLDLFPKSIQAFSIPLSIFVTGVIALSIQFYSEETINRTALPRKFKWSLISLLIGLVLFIVLLSQVVVPFPIEGGKTTVPVVVGFSRIAGCGCKPPDINDLGCIAQLSLEESKIASCWNTGPSRFLLLLSYLFLISGFATLGGLFLLQQTAQRQEVDKTRQQKHKAPRRRASPGARQKEAVRNTDDQGDQGTS